MLDARSEDQIPYNQPRTQPNRPPKHRLRRTPLLRRALQLFIPFPDIRCRIRRIRNKLIDIIFLRS